MFIKCGVIFALINKKLEEEMVNENLPIIAFEEEIVEAIKNNPVTIIVADTGAGKSTQVPQILLNAGMNAVVTEPRRLAARSLAARVADEYGCELGQEIVYSVSGDNNTSEKTRVVYVTDGLEMVREIHTDFRPDVLVIDEVHEWNLNIETLIAWSKKRLAIDPDFKVVIMSATIDAVNLSRHLFNAPIIDVPGRLFPVVEEDPGTWSVVNEIRRLVDKKRNVLVFQPGLGEISNLVKELEEAKVNAEILPLHGQMEPGEQDRVFQHYTRPKVVVATNVAQTSITIDDIDAVIDTELERRIETNEGIEGLYLRRISKSDADQRKGRAGRCREGIYISVYEGFEEQSQFPIAEIERVRLDQLVLRLTIQGFDATELDFFHQPDREAITEAMKSLKNLGAIDKQGNATKIGKEIAKLPISVKYARMIVEAKKLRVLDDVLTIASCLEVNGLAERKSSAWKSLSQEEESDLLHQRDLFNAARQMKGSKDLRKNGIHPKSFFKALEIRKHLCDALIKIAKKEGEEVDFSSTGNRQDIINACVIAMVDHVYRVGFSSLVNGDMVSRKLNQSSVVKSFRHDYLIGEPIDISFKNRFGNQCTLNLVNMVTPVTPMMLVKLAPHMVWVKRFGFELISDSRVLFRHCVMFGNLEVSDTESVVSSWEELPNHLNGEMTIDDVRREIIVNMFQKEQRYGRSLSEDTVGDVDDTIDSLSHIDMRPVLYGRDPLTGRDLYAFPALVKGFVYYRKVFFQTKEEADKAQEKLSIQPEAVQPMQVQLEKVVGTAVAAEPEAVWTPMTKKGWWKCPNGHSVKAKKDASEVFCDLCGEEMSF